MKNVLFIGAGKMAQAIAAGIVNNGFAATNIKAYDISANAIESFYAATGQASTPQRDLKELAHNADVVVLAIKPQHFESVVTQLSQNNIDVSNKLVVSIMAGITLAQLGKLQTQRLARVMPNTPAVIGMGTTVFALGDGASQADSQIVSEVFSAVGKCYAIPESQINAATGVSGSGPAYVFEFIQAMAAAGLKAGLPLQLATQLAAQTVEGAAKMVSSSDIHPAILRDQVTSPGGSTASALAALDEKAFRGVVASAVEAAIKRTIELGN